MCHYISYYGFFIICFCNVNFRFRKCVKLVFCVFDARFMFYMCYTPLPLTLHNLNAAKEQKSFTGSLIQLNTHLERFFLLFTCLGDKCEQ